MLELQRSKQNSKNVKVTNELTKSPMYTLGQLVYLYKPSFFGGGGGGVCKDGTFPSQVPSLGYSLVSPQFPFQVTVGHVQ